VTSHCNMNLYTL